MTILLVEDNYKTREYVKQILYKYVVGISKIVECDDGNEALAFYKKNKPEWVLMDIHIKTVDGLTATQDILASDSEAKVIIVTMYNDPEYREAAKMIGAYEYVLKENLSDIPDIINTSKNKPKRQNYDRQ